MSSSKYRYIGADVQGVSKGTVYDLTLDSVCIEFRDDDLDVRSWPIKLLAKEFIKVIDVPKVKGYIFRISPSGWYAGHLLGHVNCIEDAYVYSMEEIKEHFSPCWGHKDLGTWVVVYEAS